MIFRPHEGGDCSRRQVSRAQAQRGPHRIDQAVAIHVRQAEVAEQDIEPCAAQALQGQLGRRHRSHLGAAIGQHSALCFQHVGMVVHQQQAQTFQVDSAFQSRQVHRAGAVARGGRQRQRAQGQSHLTRGLRKAQAEGGAEALAFAARDDAAGMQFHQVLDDRQPQAQASMHPRRRAVGLAEALKKVGQKVCGNALAVVADGEFDVPFADTGRQGHQAARRREFQGVVHKVANDLMQAHRVAHDLAQGLLRQLQRQAHALGCEGRPRGVGRGGCNRVQVHLLDRHQQLARHDAAYIEQVGHQLRLRLRVARDRFDATAQRRFVNARALQHLGPAHDGG